MIELLKIRSDLLARVKVPIPGHCLLPNGYDLSADSIRDYCDDCGDVKLQRQRTVKRRPAGILLGRPTLRHHIKKCRCCGREYSCEWLDDVKPSHGNYCYDVMIKVGLERFRRNRQNREIQKDILDLYGLFLPQSTIGDLADRFLDFFAAVHYRKADGIRHVFDCGEGYVAHFDGTCEAGTDIVFTIIDEISGLVLLTDRMPTENTDDLKKLFEKCRDLFGNPLATMRDLSSNIAAARDDVFAGVRDLVCQYHFLENVGNALVKQTHQDLTRYLRKLKIKASLKSLRKGLVKRNKKAPPISEKALKRFLESPEKYPGLDDVQLRKHLVYFVLRWLSDYSAELKGEYFPFEHPNLIFYRRCVKVFGLLNTILMDSDEIKGSKRQTLSTIHRVLEPVENDPYLVDLANRLEKGVSAFDKLRAILKFERLDDKPILRSRPPFSTIKHADQTKKRLEQYYRELQKAQKDNDPDVARDSKTLIRYLDKYKDKLVGHVLVMPDKNRRILLDRTNNICEQHFGSIKRKWRRKLGVKKLTRHLQAARHEELLTSNLDRQNYVNVVYDGDLNNMAPYFAEVSEEALTIRRRRMNIEEKHTMPVSIKSLRQPGILSNVFKAIGEILGCPTTKIEKITCISLP